MAKLLYSATTADGNRTEGFVNAPSVVAAREQLEQQGFKQVVLREELRPPPAAAPAHGLDEGQRRDLARFRQVLLQSPTLQAVLIEQALRARLWLLADAGLVFWGLWRGDPTWIAAGVLAAAAPFALTAWNFRHADRYQRLLRQYAVGNWDGVRTLAKELRGSGASRAELDFDLDLRLACIYARDHALAEALARLEPWRKRMTTRPGVFEARIAAVHLMAGDTAGHVQMLARALELNPQDPIRQAEHALALARFGDLDQAEPLLAGMPPEAQPEPVRGLLLWARGLLQLRRRDPAAQDMLGQAVAAWLPGLHQPALWTSLALCACDHAVAMHEAGAHDAARARIAEVWPVLEAHATVPLLRMLEADDLLPVRSTKTP